MILTLCGSAKFEKKFKSLNEKLTLFGHTVFSLAVYPSDKGSKDWYEGKPKIKGELDAAHFRKIAASEGIVVINVDGYVGESTYREIDYARQRAKEVIWLEYPGTESFSRGDHMLDQLLARKEHMVEGLVPAGWKNAR